MISLGKDGSGPLYLRIYNQLKQDITSGALAENTVLPGSRLLASMPTAMPGRANRANTLNTLPRPELRAEEGIDGSVFHCQASAISDTGTRQRKAPRQPTTVPRYAPSGAAITMASALPPLTTARVPLPLTTLPSFVPLSPIDGEAPPTNRRPCSPPGGGRARSNRSSQPLSTAGGATPPERAATRATTSPTNSTPGGGS